MNKVRPYSKVLERLRKAGLRPTRQRLALAKMLLENGNRHFSAEMLHAEALSSSVRVSLATVYNTLHQFTIAGLIREIYVDSSRSYFDTNTSKHHHFFHEDTAQLEDIPDDQIIVAKTPDPPAGTMLKSVDVVVRVSAS